MKAMNCRAALVISVLLATVAQAAEPRLPGAIPAIEAINFPSLQAAIDAVPDEGGIVILPPGTFEIREPLVISARRDFTLRGSGTATHIKNLNEAGEPALILRVDAPGPRPQNARQWRIQLSDLRITGNEKSGDGILADQVNEIFLRNLTVSEHGGNGIVLDECYEDPRVSDCLITYNKGAGINALGGHDLIVSANQFEENQDALRFIDGFNLCMTGNNIDDHLRHGVVIENTYGSVVSGNMIEECNGSAIILDRDCYGLTLSANMIAHNDSGIDLRNAHGCTISANNFVLQRDFGLRLGMLTGRLAVSGNNFTNSYLAEGRTRRGEQDRAGGIMIEGASNSIITGNMFATVRPGALVLSGEPGRGIVFVNNMIVDSPSEHEALRPTGRVEGNFEVDAPRTERDVSQ